LIMMILNNKNINQNIPHHLVIILNSILLPPVITAMVKPRKKQLKLELKLKEPAKRKMKFLFTILKIPNILVNSL
jgi:hypothetical protein